MSRPAAFVMRSYLYFALLRGNSGQGLGGGDEVDEMVGVLF